MRGPEQREVRREKERGIQRRRLLLGKEETYKWLNYSLEVVPGNNGYQAPWKADGVGNLSVGGTAVGFFWLRSSPREQVDQLNGKPAKDDRPTKVSEKNAMAS